MRDRVERCLQPNNGMAIRIEVIIDNDALAVDNTILCFGQPKIHLWFFYF